MTYRDFLVLSEYLNNNYKGSFTPEEVRENASVYYSEYVHHKPYALRQIVQMVREDIDYMPEEIVRMVQEVER